MSTQATDKSSTLTKREHFAALLFSGILTDANAHVNRANAAAAVKGADYLIDALNGTHTDAEQMSDSCKGAPDSD